MKGFVLDFIELHYESESKLRHYNKIKLLDHLKPYLSDDHWK